jgi:flagellar hook-length control protein FliK
VELSAGGTAAIHPTGPPAVVTAPQTDTEAASSPAPSLPTLSLPTRDDVPVPPVAAHAANGPAAAVLAITAQTAAEARPAPSTAAAAILDAGAMVAPAPATVAATTPRNAADAASAAVATAAQVSGALAQLSQPVAGGSATIITLHLAPPALGDVAIRISAPSGATPVVTITASHQGAADALASARPNLEASLLRAGLPADTRVIVQPPNTPPSGGDTADRGSRQPGGQPRRPPPPPPDSGPDFAETLDISA